MVTSQWLLARVARSEQRVYMEVGFGERQFALLAQVNKQRAHLERSFRTAIADMKQAQKERQRAAHPARTVKANRANRASAGFASRPNTTPAPGPRPPTPARSARKARSTRPPIAVSESAPLIFDNPTQASN